jgi:hypothetical protein
MPPGRRRRWTLVALITQATAFSDIKRARDLKPIIREDSPSSNPVIQFVPGVDETVIPEVSMTRSATSQRDGKFFTGTATFWYDYRGRARQICERQPVGDQCRRITHKPGRVEPLHALHEEV